MKKIITTIMTIGLFAFSGMGISHDHSKHERKSQFYEHRVPSKSANKHWKKNHKKHHAAKYMSEGRIAYNLGKINKAEIMVSESIKHRLRGEVRSFANMMIISHRENQNKGMKLISKEGILPEVNKKGLKIQEMAKLKTETLMSKSKGRNLDRAYIASQIQMHRHALKCLNKEYIPNATTASFKAFLIKTRSHVRMHLDRALELQSMLQ